MVNNQKSFFLKLQATPGVPETSLDSADYIDVLTESSEIKMEPAFSEVKFASNDFTQDPPVPGRVKGSVTLRVPIRSFGVGVEPDFAKLLACAQFAKTEVGDYYEYRPSGAITSDCTIWNYNGGSGANQSIVRKIGNVKFGWKLTFDFKDTCYAVLEVNGVGRMELPFVAATVPAITQNGNATPSLLVSSINFGGGTNYRILSLEIDSNQQVADTVDPTHISGVGETEITDRAIKFKAKVYTKLPAVIDPIADVVNQTESPLTITWGTGDLCVISSSKAQFTMVEDSEDTGVTCYDISGQFNQNDFVLKIKDPSA